MKKKIIAMILAAAMSCQSVMIYAADAEVEFSDDENSFVDDVQIDGADVDDTYSNEDNDIVFSDEEEKNDENITSNVINKGNSQKDFCDGETIEDVSEVEVHALSIGDYEYSVNDDGNITITKYTGNESNLVIPNSIAGHVVIAIGQSAFKECKSLTEVEIPDSVTEIGQYAFAYCEKLSKVKLSSGLKNLRYMAFSNCPEITEITIPKSLESVDNSFQYTGIEGISFEQGITRIAPGLMQGATKLIEVVIPEGVTSIGSSAFSGCTGLTKVKIPDSVTEIGSYVFDGCSSLTIYGYSKSYAETYANNNNIPFIVLDDEEEESGKGFDLTRDGHCVINAAKCFSYDSWTNWFGIAGYKIPLERYQEVYGDSYTKHIYDQNISSWDGNCFGMSSTAVLFFLGKLPVANYTHDVGSLAAGGYDDMVSSDGKTYLKLKKNSNLTKLIERYQIWQYSDEYYQLYFKNKLKYESGTDAKAFSNVINKIKNTKEPLIVVVHWDESDGSTKGHALVVDSSRTPQDLGDNWVRIYLYDPNNPYFEYFDKKTPVACYAQAENRFLDVNISNGQWKMAAAVNGSGTSVTDIGYDGSGNKLRNSTIIFEDVNDYPKDFNKKATFSSSGDTTSIAYASDDFEVYNSSNVLVYKMQNGVVSYSNNEIVKSFVGCGYIEGFDAGIANGKLILPKGQYSVTVEKGAISYMTDNDYSGIVTKERTVVENIDSTTLSIASSGTNKVNIVIENTQSEKYTSVETDIVANDGGCEISLDNDKLNFNTEIEQQVDINVISDEQEKKIEDVQIDNSTKIELSEEHTEHSWDVGEVTKKATCTEKGVKTYICTVCGVIKTEDIPATGHKYGSWKTTKAATVLKYGVKTRTCFNCGKVERKNIEKLKPTGKVNVSSIPLKVKQSTTKVKVIGLAKGDYIKSWKSSNTKIIIVNSKGKITAQNKTGKAIITVTMASGLKKNVKVTVQKSAVATKKLLV